MYKLFIQFNIDFLVDGSRAGSGNLEILVNGGHVTSFVRTLGSQRFLASFVPHEAVTHLVEMTFNGEAVSGKLSVSSLSMFIIK
jgi:filamin